MRRVSERRLGGRLVRVATMRRDLMRCALVLCVLGWASSSAHAVDGVRVERLLRVESGATCLTAHALSLEVEQWLDGAEVPSDITIVVEGSRYSPRHVKLLVVRGRRTVAHRAFAPGPAQCNHLNAVVALAIALSLKASLLEEDLGQPLPDDPAARARDWSLAGSGLLTFRLLPELAPGLGLSARYGFTPHVALRVGVLGVAAFDVELEGPAGGSFDATLAGFRADVCARGPLFDALQGAACVGLLGGALHAVGSDDVAMAQTSTVSVFALANAAELELQLSPHWSVELALSVTFLLHDVRVGTADRQGAPQDARSLPSPGFAVGLGPVYYFQ